MEIRNRDARGDRKKFGNSRRKKKKRQTLDGLKCVKGTTNRIMKTF